MSSFALLMYITRITAYCSLGATVSLLYVLHRQFRKSRTIAYTKQDVVFITGCDTGLGFTMALHCKHRLNCEVIATCVNVTGVGARRLIDEGVQVVFLDLTNEKSVRDCFSWVDTFVTTHSLRLKVFINNAAVMIFGEFDWTPESLIMRQLDVNLLGPIKLTKMFTPLFFKFKTRIINVCSHCSLEALPGLVPYAISKSGMLAWTHGLRQELFKYSIDVVALIPGSFYTDSSIMSLQSKYNTLISEHIKSKPSVIREAYGEYWSKYLTYVGIVSTVCVREENPELIRDEKVIDNFHAAITDAQPQLVYLCNNVFRYKLYHTLFRMLPVSRLKDKLLLRFMLMPRFD